MQTFAAICSEVCFADKADLCKCGYCQRSILFYVQKIVFGIPVVFIKPVIDASRSGGK
jgi:hypothetical protein